MKLRLWIATRFLGLLSALALGSGTNTDAAGLVGKWIGQDGHDKVGGEPGPSKNDYQDIHIAIKGLPADREIAEVVIQGDGGGEWKLSSKNRFTVLVVRSPRSASADLYVDPYMREVGRNFGVTVKLDNGREESAFFPGGKADLNLRAPGSSMEVRWIGQDGNDKTNPSINVGPDGLEDVHISLSKLSVKPDLKSVEVTGPGGLVWHAGLNPKGLTSAELTRSDDRSKADFYFSPPKDLAGISFKVILTYNDDRTDTATVLGQKVVATKPMPKVALPTIATSKAAATWLGQDGSGTEPGDVHVSIEGGGASRSIVAAVLSDGVATSWVHKGDDRIKLEVGYNPGRLQIRRSSPNRLDLVFPPTRDESNATMTLRMIDQSGREEILRFPGGKSDPDLRAPALPPGTIAAKPGDDLNNLASRFGTIHLAKGVYSLAKPLILSRPIRIVGEPGSTLQFSQNPDQAPWTAAIKIHAGGTTLEGFAVRFDGPIKWDREVSYGPTVIGTTDNRDNVPADDRFKIQLLRLDLQGPAANSKWEEAVHLIRVGSASSGRIEKNNFKGGAVTFAGGPWTIADNVSKGTLPDTFIYELFGAHHTHDLTLTGNHLKPEAPTGKSWRFLVLAQRGAHDLIKDNVVEGGVGPREDDPHEHENSPEVVLTEAYRLHFEGKPASISHEGRLLAIPRPQGGAADTGDSLAILSGPQAGQWRTIAQTLGPQLYWLDEPIAKETEVVSIATGFVRETFEGNTVDCRGSGITMNFSIAGNHFGTKLIRNHLIGGGEAIRLSSMPTEEPGIWGWSHTPFLGALIEGNIIEDCKSARFGIDHSPHIKTNKGRIYMLLNFKDNTFRWSGSKSSPAKPTGIEFGTTPSLDPGEVVVAEEGTKIEGAPAKTLWVRSATINGKPLKETPLKREEPAGARGANGPNRRD